MTWQQTSRSHPVRGNTSPAAITNSPLEANVESGSRLQCFQLGSKCCGEQQRQKLGQTVSLPVAIGTPSLCQVIDGLGKP